MQENVDLNYYKGVIAVKISFELIVGIIITLIAYLLNFYVLKLEIKYLAILGVSAVLGVLFFKGNKLLGNILKAHIYIVFGMQFANSVIYSEIFDFAFDIMFVATVFIILLLITICFSPKIAKILNIITVAASTIIAIFVLKYNIIFLLGMLLCSISLYELFHIEIYEVMGKSKLFRKTINTTTLLIYVGLCFMCLSILVGKWVLFN